MVTKLSDLANVLQEDALPSGLSRDLFDRQQEISTHLEHGQSIEISMPNGEIIKITPTK
jgi:hypothetical protein